MAGRHFDAYLQTLKSADSGLIFEAHFNAVGLSVLIKQSETLEIKLTELTSVLIEEFLSGPMMANPIGNRCA